MKFGKRGKAEAPADEPVAESSRAPPPTVSWPAPEPEPEPAGPEPVVDAEAVELTSGPLPSVGARDRPSPPTIPAPRRAPEDPRRRARPAAAAGASVDGTRHGRPIR